LRNFGIWSRDKRALSPIFATVLLATIIIVFGSTAFYYSSNITQTATNDYVKTLSDSQQAMAERISFENVVFIPSDSSNTPASPTLTIYILNSGSANNVEINTLFLYDASHNIIPVPYTISPNTHSAVLADTSFLDLTGGAQIKPLNVGKEGVFAIKLDSTLTSLPSMYPGYTIRLITKSGSSFDYAP
jgi:hypothetical protein